MVSRRRVNQRPNTQPSTRNGRLFTHSSFFLSYLLATQSLLTHTIHMHSYTFLCIHYTYSYAFFPQSHAAFLTPGQRLDAVIEWRDTECARHQGLSVRLPPVEQ